MDSNATIAEREKMLKYQKDLFHTAADRKGQRAENRPTRLQLEEAFSASNAAARSESASQEVYSVRQTVVGYSYPPCTTPLADLKPITIDELRLEENHVGRVLFVRTFGTPFRVQAVQGAIVDSAGDVDRIAAYNFEIGLTPEMVLPTNTILAVKHPYYKLTMDNGVIVRVDHPSDLMILRDYDHRAPSTLLLKTPLAEQWHEPLFLKTRGNVAFQNKNYHKAIELYSAGLNNCDGDKDVLVESDLHRNRAIANINLGRYEAGYNNAFKSFLKGADPKLLGNNLKALYRGGCAAYALGYFTEAEVNFNKVLKVTPDDRDAVRELARVQMRMKESTKGEYDFETMADSASEHHNRLDHGDFIMKVLRRGSDFGGHGLFAKVAISAGELVLCEKAFAVAYEKDQETEHTVIINLNRDSASIGTHATRLVAAVHKMLHGHVQAARFSRLYDGGYLPKATSKAVDGIVPVDTFQVQAALEYNGFGCPLISTVAEEETDSTIGSGSTGAWVTASFINHDCSGNAQRAFIGDMMIIHATKDIAKDEEIFMRYKNPDDDNAEFQTTLKQSWNFTCKCRLCVAESATPDTPRKHRVEMLKRAKDFLNRNLISQDHPPKAGVIARAEKLRQQVANSYDGNLFKGLPRLGLQDLDHWLCMAYILSGAENKVREAGLACLRDQGFELTIKKNKVSIARPNCRPDVTGIHAATYIAAGYYKEGNKEVGDQLEAFAQELYRIGYGTMRGYHSRSSSE